MAYFSNFPKIIYDLNKDKNRKVITDILRRVAIRQKVKTNASVFENYQTNGLDRPEILADKIYDDLELHWIIMMMNDVVDPFYDFALDDQSMETIIDTKYPGQAFFLNDGLTDDATYPHTDIFSYTRASEPSVMFPKGATLLNNTQGWTNEATVYRFNRTYQRLEVTDITGSFSAGDQILARVGGETVTRATIGRIVTSNPSALHHFEDSDGNFLPPLPTSLVEPITKNLKEYIDRFKKPIPIPEESSSVVTNRGYEDSLNEAKREIKLLSPKFVSIVKQEFEELIKQ